MIDFTEATEALGELVTRVSDDDLRRPTPCTDYSVSDLLMHIDEGATGFTSAAGGTLSSPAVTGVGDEPSRRCIADHLRDLARAWLEPGAWEGIGDIAGLALPNETWGRIALTEVVVHGWDLAVATGHVFDPPEDLVRACHEHLDSFVDDAPIPELWGDRVEMEAASLLDRTVAVAGRDPQAWRC